MFQHLTRSYAPDCFALKTCCGDRYRQPHFRCSGTVIDEVQAENATPWLSQSLMDQVASIKQKSVRKLSLLSITCAVSVRRSISAKKLQHIKANKKCSKGLSCFHVGGFRKNYMICFVFSIVRQHSAWFCFVLLARIPTNMGFRIQSCTEIMSIHMSISWRSPDKLRFVNSVRACETRLAAGVVLWGDPSV